LRSESEAATTRPGAALDPFDGSPLESHDHRPSRIASSDDPGTQEVQEPWKKLVIFTTNSWVPFLLGS
jgi:hypothetical protein